MELFWSDLTPIEAKYTANTAENTMATWDKHVESAEHVKKMIIKVFDLSLSNHKLIDTYDKLLRQYRDISSVLHLLAPEYIASLRQNALSEVSLLERKLNFLIDIPGDQFRSCLRKYMLISDQTTCLEFEQPAVVQPEIKPAVKEQTIAETSSETKPDTAKRELQLPAQTAKVLPPGSRQLPFSFFPD